MALTREQILGADDLKREEVLVEEWGMEPLFVRMMTGAERSQLEELWSTGEAKSKIDQKRVAAAIVVMTVCDETGKLLFAHEDVDAVAAKNWAAVEKVARVSIKLNDIYGARSAAKN